MLRAAIVAATLFAGAVGCQHSESGDGHIAMRRLATSDGGSPDVQAVTPALDASAGGPPAPGSAPVDAGAHSASGAPSIRIVAAGDIACGACGQTATANLIDDLIATGIGSSSSRLSDNRPSVN